MEFKQKYECIISEDILVYWSEKALSNKFILPNFYMYVYIITVYTNVYIFFI